MQEKPPHELDPGQAHHFLPIRISVIPEPEIHSLIFYSQDPVVADRNPVGIAGKIADYRTHILERPFGIHYPVFFIEIVDELLKCLFVFVGGKRSFQIQLAIAVEILQPIEENPTEALGQYFYRKKIPRFAGNPTFPVDTKSPSRDYGVHMRVQIQLLPPCMEHADRPCSAIEKPGFLLPIP